MKKTVLDRLARLAEAENRFLRGEFLAPVLDGSTIRVRLEGIVCELTLRQRFTGWGLFTAETLTQARLKRKATLKEQQAYLGLFPRRELILVERVGENWLGWPARQGDTRFGSPRLLPVRFAEEVQRFDHIFTRFDGSNCFFEQPDESIDPLRAEYLRSRFADEISPELLHRSGLTLEDRIAYAAAQEIQTRSRQTTTEGRLRETLKNAGAELRGLLERDDGLRVEFEVDGVRHVSVVNKDDFSLQLAGICLNGEDGNFDLNSLVGILRQSDEVLRIGIDNGGMNEAQYWQVHPRR